MSIGFVVIENLHDSEHIWRRSWVAGFNKLFQALDVIPIWVSAEHCEVNDQESGSSTASSCAIDKYFMTLLIDQSVQNLGCLEQLCLVFIGVEITNDLVCIGIDSLFTVLMLLPIDIFVSGFMIMASLDIKDSCASMLINLVDIRFS